MDSRPENEVERPKLTSPMSPEQSWANRIWQAAQQALVPGQHQWVVVCAPAPEVVPEDWLEGFEDQSCVLWAPPQEETICGVGVAVAITSRGEARFDDIQTQSETLWRNVVRLKCEPVALEWQPRLFGGFAFSDSGSSSPQWREFGAARFFLPRLTYIKKGPLGVISVVIRRSELENEPQGETFQLLERALARFNIAGGVSVAGQSQTAPVVQVSEQGSEQYASRVANIVELIGRGEVDKVVAAREVRLRSTHVINPLATAYALRDQAPLCLRFVFRLGSHSFLGATPECLVRRSGLKLATEALAGTIDGNLIEAEQILTASAKDVQEHQWVVSAIESVLRPLCESIEMPSQPQVRKLRHLLHLCTPISGALTHDIHILRLARELHPSPAVGGVPTASARTWIEDHEPFDRGWYSGIVGWFDSQGDGCFNVALRSGLAGPEGIRLYAGAGIVKDSLPAAEFEETTLKLTSLRASLRCLGKSVRNAS